jgi:nucleoside-diphosphate-sugar epimerase
MELEGKRIGVTGATGFLGRYIVDALLARGAQVVGVVRNPERVPELVERGVEMRRAELGDEGSLAEAFAGLDALVSNAALFSVYTRDWSRYEQTNLAGTRNVFNAARQAGLRRVVHVSSIAGYNRPPRTDKPIDEDFVKLTLKDLGRFNAYYVSKAVSEQIAWELAEEAGIALTCVRPGPIYGAFDPNLTPILKRVFGLPLGVMPMWLRLPFVYAGDVAEAIALCLEHDVARGRAYNTAGDGDTSWRDMAQAWRSAGGRVSGVMLPVPAPVKIQIDNTRAYEELGWHNRPLLDGLRETFEREPGLMGR